MAKGNSRGCRRGIHIGFRPRSGRYFQSASGVLLGRGAGSCIALGGREATGDGTFPLAVFGNLYGGICCLAVSFYRLGSKPCGGSVVGNALGIGSSHSDDDISACAIASCPWSRTTGTSIGDVVCSGVAAGSVAGGITARFFLGQPLRGCLDFHSQGHLCHVAGSAGCVPSHEVRLKTTARKMVLQTTDSAAGVGGNIPSSTGSAAGPCRCRCLLAADDRVAPHNPWATHHPAWLPSLSRRFYLSAMQVALALPSTYATFPPPCHSGGNIACRLHYCGWCRRYLQRTCRSQPGHGRCPLVGVAKRTPRTVAAYIADGRRKNYYRMGCRQLEGMPSCHVGERSLLYGRA